MLLAPVAAAGVLPSASAGAARIRVQVVAQKTAQSAGVHGVLFTVRRTSGATGPVGLSVDDSTFRYAYGGDYASRLHLVQLPGCALTTPQSPKCQTQTALGGTAGAPLSARISLPATSGAMVLAATAGTSGSSGDYSATKLASGGTWSTAGNTGSFSYNYPITVPAAIGGASPTVSLSYDSSSQDALTAGTNNQSSWVGDGWSSTESYVERTYRSCTDIKATGAPANDGDECWDGQILTLSLGGKSTPIVYDDVNHSFHPVEDDGTTKIEDLTGATNGTTNGEYFKVTEDGVQYFFGLNHLPGWASGKAETGSAWSEPVYNAHGGVAACPSGSFADTACTLGYRFNLDYSVDLHNNATAYYYNPETGYYGADMKNTAVAYTRGGTLARIDYGMTASTVYSATAPEQIVFDASAERCIAGSPVAANTCADSQFTVANASYWPDVPIDQNCAKGATDCTNHGPSFWSRKRLTSITTQVQIAGATQQVDQYKLVQSFPDGGDHAPTLWLDSIQHIGLDTSGGATASASTQPISFDPPLQLANRVGTIPQMPAMYHDRIQTLTTETGAQTTVVYNTPDCSTAPASDPNDPTDAAAKTFASTNKLSCFPVYWTPDGQPNPMLDWFYLHTVASVTTTDPHNSYADGTQPELVTEYAYKGDPGWHYDDNETVKAKNRTWGQFRGYPEVDTTTGDPNVFHYTNGVAVHDQKTLTKTYYFLGMNGDTLPSGTRTVPPLVSQDGTTATVPDDNALAGEVFETDSYSSASGSLVKAAVTVPGIIGPTASRARTGLPALTAQMVRTTKTLNREAVSYGWRKTETDTFYNTALGQLTTGMPVQVDDRGETADSSNVEKCTYTRYVTDAGDLLALTAETTTTAQDCTSANATRSGALISDTLTAYDGHAFTYDGASPAGTAPTKGDITQVSLASAATGPTATAYLVKAATSYDSYGRTTSVTRTPDSSAPNGTSLAQTVSTGFTPATGALPTATVTATQVTPGFSCTTASVDSKDCQVESAILDPARALPISRTDVGKLTTTVTYDALGRTVAVWLPNENQAAGAPANTTFSYALSTTAPTVVTTGTLLDNGTYSTSETLYDAMLRVRETQATSENSSTTVTDTQYDSHGWTVVTNNSYSIAGSPSNSLAKISLVSIPDTTVTDHDGTGRATRTTEEHDNAVTSVSSTAYAGDRTTVVPPAGGVATTTVTDARGQKTELDQYTAAPTLSGDAADGFTVSNGTSTATHYSYTAAGQEKQVTASDSTTWLFSYDLLGRKYSEKDPDAGSSGYGYDDAGNLVSTTDARQVELDYTFDLTGRKLTATDKSKSGFEFASWLYDTLRIGQPTSSTRYVQGTTGGYTVATLGYTTLGKATGSKITLPASEAPLPTTWTTTYAYSINDQLMSSESDPRVGSMAADNLVYNHDPLGNPTTTGTSTATYVGGTTYTDYGEPARIVLGPSTNQAWETYSYDDQTRRLTDRQVSRTQAPGPLVDDTQYTYDASGNPTSTSSLQSETGNTATDRQCYSYDSLDRLANAWTTSSSACPAGAAAPAAGTTSTTAGSYWQSFSYDAVGDRSQSVDHATGTGADATTVYHDGCTGTCVNGPQPHTLTATTGANPTTLTYDADGNLLTRGPTAGTGTGQSLVWDDEGNLQQVTTTGSNPSTTQYLYDADGNQLLRRDPTQTVFFAGDTEIVVGTSSTPHTLLGAIRTYSIGGSGTAIAIRSSLPGGGVEYLLSDPHGTATLAMDTTTQQVSRQQYTPYGELRASADSTAWPDPTHSYLGKAQDAVTGYTDIGARKYDPVFGLFISVDPVFEATSPQQIGGYTYSGDNPVTSSDPTGLRLACGPGEDAACPSNCPNGYCKPPPTPTADPCSAADAYEPGGACFQGGGGDVTRYVAARNFIYQQIVQMLASPQFAEIHHLDNPSVLDWVFAQQGAMQVTALKNFAAIIGNNKPWDFKKQVTDLLSTMPIPTGGIPGYTRFAGDPRVQIYFNIWANISYGYVGRAEGFSALTLQVGAEVNAERSGTNTMGNYYGRQAGIDLYGVFKLDGPSAA
ncbi:RHS repeat-associated core domain-containing protein [Streptacidiphilus sp. PAMC 29251]